MADDATLLKRRARRRLIGAIALVLFVAIVVPIILDQERKPTEIQELTLQIPSQDAGRLNARVPAPLPAPSVSAEKSAASIVPTQEQGKEPAKSAQTEPKQSESKQVEPKPQESQSAVKSSAKSLPSADEARRAQALLNAESYVIPLGTFAKADNAKRVRDKAVAAGIRSYMENLKGDEKRVRAGPFGTREAAEKAREKLKSLGLSVGQVAQQ